jgi:rhodanese-related sulfurtransferase
MTAPTKSFALADPLIPEEGSVPCAERAFRINWVTHLVRDANGAPMLSPELVVHYGRSVRIVDIRSDDELTGPQGHIPGVDVIGEAEISALAARIPKDQPVVIVSRDGDEAALHARALERLGLRYVAAMAEGMIGWRHLGFSTSRTQDVVARRGQLREIGPSDVAEGNLTERDVENHVGDPLEVRWVRMAALLLQGRHACVDGRDDSGVVGTPGGDAGEMLLTCAAIETLTGKPIPRPQLEELFAHTLDAFGAFYMHTDWTSLDLIIASMSDDKRLEAALANVKDPIAWRRFFAAPPVPLRDIVLEHVLRPEHVGCGHIKQMWTQSAYGVRPGLVKEFLDLYYRAKWRGAAEIELAPLGGDHDEAAVLSVKLEGDIFPFSLIPLVAPACHGRQVFVSHPQVAAYYRHQYNEFACRQRYLEALAPKHAPELHALVDTLGEKQTMLTLGKLAKGLPIFEVMFREDGKVSVSHAGVV